MLATSSELDLPQVILFEDLVRPAKEGVMKVKVLQTRVGPKWMDPIVLFFKEGVLLLESGEAEKIRRKAPCFWLFEEQKLYKHYFSGPYLLCINPEAVEPLLE